MKKKSVMNEGSASTLSKGRRTPMTHCLGSGGRSGLPADRLPGAPVTGPGRRVVCDLCLLSK